MSLEDRVTTLEQDVTGIKDYTVKVKGLFGQLGETELKQVQSQTQTRIELGTNNTNSTVIIEGSTIKIDDDGEALFDVITPPSPSPSPVALEIVEWMKGKVTQRSLWTMSLINTKSLTNYIESGSQDTGSPAYLLLQALESLFIQRNYRQAAKKKFPLTSDEIKDLSLVKDLLKISNVVANEIN